MFVFVFSLLKSPSCMCVDVVDVVAVVLVARVFHFEQHNV